MGKKKQKKTENKNDLQERKEKRLAAERAKKRREWIVTAVTVIAALTVLGLILWKVSGAADEPSRTKAFRVGEDMVYMDEVNLCILQNVVNLGIGTEALSATADDGKSADEYYKQEIMDMIIAYKVKAKVAGQRGIALSEEEEASVQGDAATYLGSVNGSVLRELGITSDLIADVYKQRYLAHKLEETVTSELEIDEVTYCTMYMLLFPKVEMDESGDYVRDGDSEAPVMLSAEEIEKRKADADAAYKELQEGADIEEIAKKYEVDAYSGEQKNTPESFGETFSEYANKLEKGEYSPVLDTASCYAVLKMIEPNNEEMAKQIEGYYRTDMEKQVIEENKTKWYEEAGVSEEMPWKSGAWDKVTLYDFVKYVEG